MFIDYKFSLIITCLFLCIDDTLSLKKRNIFSRKLQQQQQQQQQQSNEQAISEIQQKQKYIKEIQKQQKNNIAMKNTNIFTFNFQIHKIDQFFFDISANQEVKGLVQVFWKQKDVYVLPRVLQTQKVFMEIYENQQIIIKKQFFTGCSFKFNSRATQKYRLRITSNGIFLKLVKINIEQSQSLEYSLEQKLSQISNVVNMTYLQKVEQNLLKILRQTKILINSAQNRYIFQKNTIKTTLSHVKQYFIFQQIECVIVLFICLMQIFYINKLLKTKPII